MHSHPSRTSCATSAVRRRNCLSSSALARGRVRMPEPNLRRMRLGFLDMRSCYTNRKTKVRKSNFRDFIRPQLQPRQKYRGTRFTTGSDNVERAGTSNGGDFPGKLDRFFDVVGDEVSDTAQGVTRRCDQTTVTAIDRDRRRRSRSHLLEKAICPASRGRAGSGA